MIAGSSLSRICCSSANFSMTLALRVVLPLTAEIPMSKQRMVFFSAGTRICGRQSRREAGLSFLEPCGQILELLFGKLLFRGLVVVHVPQGQESSGGVDDLRCPVLVRG